MLRLYWSYSCIQSIPWEKHDDSNALEICDQLVISAGLTNVQGRELYTDNWYMSVKMAIHMFENYGWTTCGTITPTDKNPFLKLLKGSMKEVQWGWYHEAVLELQTRSSKKYYLQCTTWKDKKQVVFLHSNGIEQTKDHYVRRHSKEKQTRDVLPAPNAQNYYTNNYNGVDRNDRDSADWSTTIQTTRYYLHIFCWALDHVVHTCYVVRCCLLSCRCFHWWPKMEEIWK